MNAFLTPEQLQAIAAAGRGQVHLIDPLTKQDYILVKADVYARFQRMISDETVYATAEMIDHLMAADDADDPQVAALQKKSTSRQNANSPPSTGVPVL